MDTTITKTPVAGVGGAITNTGIISQDGVTPISTTAITPESLQSVKPVSIPSPYISTSADALLGTTGAIKDTLTAQLKADEQAKKEAATASKDNLTSIQDMITGVTASRPDLEKAAGLDTKAQNLTDITNKLEASQRAQLNETRAIQNRGDITKEAAQGLVNDINRKYAFEQADLALLQSAANRDYSTAQSIVDRKINLQLEPLKLKLDFAKTFYEDNKDSLTKAEDRQFQSLITKNNREYETETARVKALETAKLEALKNATEQGAPASVLSAIQSATTPEQAVTSAGAYGGDLKRKLEIAKLKAETDAAGVPTITNPNAAAYSGALSVILGSTKLTKDQKATLVNSINTGSDPFAVVKNQAKDIMGQTLATSLDKYETAKTQLQSIDTLLNNYYANNGDTGIFKGNLEKTINKLGEVKDPKLVEIATNIAAALQIYRNAVSGTAYSVQEGADIASIFPGINKSEGLNKAIIAGRNKAFDTTIDSQYRNTLGKAYDDLKASSVNAKAINDPLNLDITTDTKLTNPLGI